MKQHRMEILNLLVSTQLAHNLPTGLETATISSLSKIIKSRNSKMRSDSHSYTKITNNFRRGSQAEQNRVDIVEIEGDRVASMKNTSHQSKDNSYTFRENRQIMELLLDQFFEFGINEKTKNPQPINNQNRGKQNKEEQQLYHKTSGIMENFYLTFQNISPSTIMLNLAQQLANQKFFREEALMWSQIICSNNVYEIGHLLTAYALKYLQSQFGQQFNMREEEHIDNWLVRFRIFMLGGQYIQLFIQNLFNSHYQNRQQFFDLVNQYFQLFKKRAINYIELVQFSHKVNTFISDCSICDPCLQVLLLIINPLPPEQKIRTHLNSLFKSGNQNIAIQFLLLTTLHWLALAYQSSEQQTINWMQQKIDSFITLRYQYSQYKPKTDLQQMRTQQLLIMMISQPIDMRVKSIENILLSLILSTETFHALYLRLNISYMKSSTIENKLISNLIHNSKQFALHRYILGFLPFIEGHQNQIPLLLSSQTFIENVDWHYLSTVIRSKPHFERLFEETIMGSAKLYRNAEKFINMKLKIELKPQYFEVNLLIEGLTQILTGGKKLNETEKSNYFGVITMFREQSIPISIYNNFCLLEMLFEWFILKEALINRDIKSVGVSLNFNLEQPIQTHYNTNFSVKLTRSQQFHNPQLHNPKFIQKIWTQDFIGWAIDEHISHAWNLVVGFIYSLSEGIILAKRTNQKIVRRHKIEKWVDCLAVKLSLIQRFANMQNTDRFSRHRKTILNQIQG